MGASRPTTILNRPLTAEEREQAQRWAPMAWKMARKWHKRLGGADDLGDLFYAAMLGIMRAVRTHDPSRAKFTTYAQNMCEWSIRGIKTREMQAWKRRDAEGFRVQSLEASGRQVGNQPSLVGGEIGEWDEGRMAGLLHPKVREAVMLKARGLTLDQVGDALGMSRQAVHNALRKAEPIVREAIQAA